MKLLVIGILLPSIVYGYQAATTVNWDNEESYTLNGDPTQGPPSHYNPVKVNLSGPTKSTTTEDPILPLILRKLLEDGLNNEIDEDKKHNYSMRPKTPLVYMTPPSSSKFVTSSAEEDDATSTTTDPDSDEIQSTTTTDSLEIDDTTTLPTSNLKTNNNDKPQDNTKQQLKTDQYAEKFQIYLPKVSSTARTPVIQEESEDSSIETQARPIEPREPISVSSSVTFPESQEQDQPNEDTTTATPMSEGTPNNPADAQTENSSGPPSMPQSGFEQRPIYYFFLRPRRYRIPFTTAMSNENGISPWTSPNEDSLNLYPQPQQRISTPFYNFPSFISQDYDNQQITSSPTQTYSYNSMPYRPYPYNNQVNYQQQYSPMGSSPYPQFLQPYQSPFNQRYPYMGQQNQMYNMFNNNIDNNYRRSTPYAYSLSSMPPMYNNYRVPQNSMIATPNYYTSNYDGNNFPAPMGYNGMPPNIY